MFLIRTLFVLSQCNVTSPHEIRTPLQSGHSFWVPTASIFGGSNLHMGTLVNDIHDLHSGYYGGVFPTHSVKSWGTVPTHSPDWNDVREEDDVAEEVDEPRPPEPLNRGKLVKIYPLRDVGGWGVGGLTLSARRTKASKMVARKRILVSLLISRSTSPTCKMETRLLQVRNTLAGISQHTEKTFLQVSFTGLIQKHCCYYYIGISMLSQYRRTPLYNHP